MSSSDQGLFDAPVNHAQKTSWPDFLAHCVKFKRYIRVRETMRGKWTNLTLAECSLDRALDHISGWYIRGDDPPTIGK